MFYINNFDREGPSGADVYIVLECCYWIYLACSRIYVKNIQLFTCHSNMASSFPIVTPLF